MAKVKETCSSLVGRGRGRGTYCLWVKVFDESEVI